MSRETSQASSLDMFARVMAEMRETDKKREEETREAERRREEDRERREVEREKREEERERSWRDEMTTREREAREREEKMLTRFQDQLALAGRRDPPAVDRARVHAPTLPKWADNEPLESFISDLEIQLKSAGIREENWKSYLLGQLDGGHRMRIQKHLADDDSTYDNVVRALGKAGNETMISAGEKFFEGDVSKWKNICNGLSVLGRWVTKAVEGKRKQQKC